MKNNINRVSIINLLYIVALLYLVISKPAYCMESQTNNVSATTLFKYCSIILEKACAVAKLH
jgi:hypothetical protein